MDTHNVPTPTTSHPHECGDTAYQAAAMPDECTCGASRLVERCAYCEAPMYIVVRGHHHTEQGVDVTRRVPEWVKRAQAGQLVRKDMTGTVAA